MNRKSGAQISNQQFLILSSLAESPKHGYAISKQIGEITDGRITLSAATLYENIGRLVNDGMIERDGEREIEPGVRRKVYRVTALGAQALNDQWAMLQKAGNLIPNLAVNMGVV